MSSQAAPAYGITKERLYESPIIFAYRYHERVHENVLFPPDAVRPSKRPDFFWMDRNVKGSTPLSFMFEEVFDDRLMAETIQWLRQVCEDLFPRPGAGVFLPAVGERRQ